MVREQGLCDADDETLGDRYLDGERAALDAQVLRYQDRLHRFVTWSIGTADADDTTPDAFVEAYRSLPSWRSQSTFRTWLYGVARNVCRHHARQARGREHTRDERDVGECPDDTFGPFESVAKCVEWADLMAVVTQLPRGQRVTLMLRAWEGLSYDEIAAVTNVPKGTVRSRLHSARRTVAQAIAEDTP